MPWCLCRLHGLDSRRSSSGRPRCARLAPKAKTSPARGAIAPPASLPQQFKETGLSLPKIASVCAAVLSAAATAGESPFGYVYTTDTHPRGTREIEQWLTQRYDQSRGDYDLWQGRTEFEYGVSDRLQTALYLNYASVSALHNRPDGTTGPGAFVPDSVHPDARYSKIFFQS